MGIDGSVSAGHRVTGEDRKPLDTTHQLIESNLGTAGIIHEPPCIPEHGGASNIHADNEIAEKQPFSDQRLVTITWWYAHN